MNRYIASNGKPINLAQAGAGFAKIELTKTLKTEEPEVLGKTLLMYEESVGCEVTDATLIQALADNGIKVSDETNCPMQDGKPMKVHVATTNMQNQIYISEFYVGNPPQKLRGVFDTGSTNTWVLNDKTKLFGDPKKEVCFHQDKSSSFKETKQEAEIFFGSGSLRGNFVVDDIRLGGCDEASGGLVHIKE